jgi:ribosomal protein L22
MSAHKARRVINQIPGRSYEQALMLLEFMPYLQDKKASTSNPCPKGWSLHFYKNEIQFKKLGVYLLLWSSVFFPL